jgi:hypothetical protein
MYNAPEIIATGGQVWCRRVCLRFYLTMIQG